MNNIRILADDFTGALDAAAPFASMDAPVRLILAGTGGAKNQMGAAKLTISSESRDIATGDSNAAVDRAFAMLRGAGGPETAAGTRAEAEAEAEARTGADAAPLWFKKVDSVLRGNSIGETIEMMRVGGFDACIFAPAFPEMGRRTRDGLHEVRSGDGWSPADVHDLRAAFAAHGVSASMFTPGERVSGVVIGNALTQGDLDDLVAQCRGMENILWAGSRGLAQALNADFGPCMPPRLSAVIAGTAHPVTRRQVADATQKGLFDGLASPVLIDPVPMAANAAQTIAALMADVPKLVLRPGDGLMVIGGDTLSAVLAASAAQSMECMGEIAPGLPVSRILGGQFDGVVVITKSGGFGDDALLERLIG